MNHKLPPGPKGHWLMGSFPEFRPDILGLFEQCVREYGDVVRLRIATVVPQASITMRSKYGLEMILKKRSRNVSAQ